MIDVSDKTLEATLQKAGFTAHIEGDTKQVVSSVKTKEHEFPLFCRMLSEGELVQVIAFVPVSVEEKAVVDLSRFLHMLNKELDMPGFCVDEQSNTVFYRVVVPTLGKKMDENVMTAYIKTIENVCSTFGTVLIAVAAGAMTMNEITELMQKKAEANV